KMAAGIALSEDDRKPWLRELANRIPGWEAAGGAVLACSALRAEHRAILRDASNGARFVFLEATPTTLRERLERRRDHYMPPSVLDSQLATLERPSANEAFASRPTDHRARSHVPSSPPSAAERRLGARMIRRYRPRSAMWDE